MVLVPAAVLLVAALAGTVAQQFSVPMAVEQSETARAAFLNSPYLRAQPMERQSGFELVRTGRAAGVLDSDRDAGEGRPSTLELTLGARADEDLARNLEMILIGTALELSQQAYTHQDVGRVVIDENGLLARPVSDTAYLATGIVAFAGLFGALAGTAQLTARDWESDTAREIFAAPRGYGTFALAKISAGVLQACLSVGVVFVIVSVVLGELPAGNPFLLALVLLGMIGTGATLGLLIGCGAQRIVPAVIASLALSVSAWFIGGGLGPVAIQSELTQWIAWKLPSTYGFTGIQDLMWHPTAPGAYLWPLLIGVGVLFAICVPVAVRLLSIRPLGRGRS